MQHRAVIVELRIKLKNKSCLNNDLTTCNYDINKYRANHNKIESKIKQLNWNSINTDEIWAKMSQDITQILTSSYPKEKTRSQYSNRIMSEKEQFITNSNYKLFGEIKMRSKQIQTMAITKFWEIWKGNKLEKQDTPYSKNKKHTHKNKSN